MAATGPRFTCEACGKRYAWKPELAGRKAKCKCGHIMAVPAEPPGDDDDILDLVPGPDSAPQSPPTTLSAVPAGSPAAAVAPLPTATPPSRSPHQPRTPPRVSTPAARAPTSGTHMPAVAPAEFESTSLEALAARHGIPRTLRSAPIESSSLNTGKTVAIAVLILVLLGGAIAAKFLLSGRTRPKPKGLGDDVEVQSLIDGKNGKDVADWLNSPNPRRMLQGMTNAQAVEWAGYIKKMGAVQVWAWGEVMLQRVAIELPQDPEKRVALFKFEQDWNYRPMPTQDVGQRYLLLNMRY